MSGEPYDIQTAAFLQRLGVKLWYEYTDLPYDEVRIWCQQLDNPADIVADLKRLRWFRDEHGAGGAAGLTDTEPLTGGEHGPIVAGTKTPMGGYWCDCKVGVVTRVGDVCLACRDGWTPEPYRAKA